MSNIWHLVLSTGFPRAPLGTESKIYWQTQLLNTQRGASAPPADRGGSVQSDCGAHSRLRLGLWLHPIPHHPFQDIQQPIYRRPPLGCLFFLVRWP